MKTTNGCNTTLTLFILHVTIFSKLIENENVQVSKTHTLPRSRLQWAMTRSEL